MKLQFHSLLFSHRKTLVWIRCFHAHACFYNYTTYMYCIWYVYNICEYVFKQCTINVDILVSQWQTMRSKLSQSLFEELHYLELLIVSVQFSRSVVSDSFWPHESQHAKPPCPSPTPRVYSNTYPSSRWCHPAISSSVVPFSSRPQSFPASGSFPMSQLFAWGGQSIGVSASASVLPMNTQD